MQKSVFILVVSFWVCFPSCRENSRRDVAAKIIAEWTGREIQFPAGIPCQSSGRDTVCIDPHHPATYKIMLYVDSTGCNTCRMKISVWKQLMAEADSLFPGQMDLLMFYQPKNRDVKEVMSQMRLYDFRYPVFIDTENLIDKSNRFPAIDDFRCFLLDGDNKVVLIGNPTINPAIWELYKQQISGKKRQSNPVTTISATPVRQELPMMKKGETYSCVFEIENTGSNPFVILGVRSSCGCTVPAWSRQPVAPGGKTEIMVEVKPDETGFFNKTIDVYGNIEESIIKLSMIGTVE
ncbi:MAG: DUF1573 domain-containing protein [Tannerella sp.]|jgi:hypothetical protein|nr:DUF1573 domain-containing protein [Tannerella sp.]